VTEIDFAYFNYERVLSTAPASPAAAMIPVGRQA
jgi:hypothetical protein